MGTVGSVHTSIAIWSFLHLFPFFIVCDFTWLINLPWYFTMPQVFQCRKSQSYWQCNAVFKSYFNVCVDYKRNNILGVYELYKATARISQTAWSIKTMFLLMIVFIINADKFHLFYSIKPSPFQILLIYNFCNGYCVIATLHKNICVMYENYIDNSNFMTGNEC